MRDLEELLDETILCVERYRAGRLAATEAAIAGGRLLEVTRPRLIHGDWLPWLERVGLNRATANRWMQVSRLGLTAQEIMDAGGMRAALESQAAKQTPELATRREEVEAEVEAVVDDLTRAKAAYYAALTRRKQLIGVLAKLDPKAKANVSP